MTNMEQSQQVFKALNCEGYTDEQINVTNSLIQMLETEVSLSYQKSEEAQGESDTDVHQEAYREAIGELFETWSVDDES